MRVSTPLPRREGLGGGSVRVCEGLGLGAYINFLPLNCNFSLKIFVGYKKMLIFASKFTPLVRIFALSARGQEY